jgi:hypothetical protein
VADWAAQIVADDAKQFRFGVIGIFEFGVEQTHLKVFLLKDKAAFLLVAVDDHQRGDNQNQSTVR